MVATWRFKLMAMLTCLELCFNLPKLVRMYAHIFVSTMPLLASSTWECAWFMHVLSDVLHFATVSLAIHHLLSAMPLKGVVCPNMCWPSTLAQKPMLKTTRTLATLVKCGWQNFHRFRSVAGMVVRKLTRRCRKKSFQKFKVWAKSSV